MRSDTIKKGIERIPHRALLFATGITREDLGKPFIGIASSFTDLVPGHTQMRPLESAIENGIYAGGGRPLFLASPESATESRWGIPECIIPWPRGS